MGSNSGFIRNLSDTLKRNVRWRSGCEHSVITRGFHFRNRVLLTLILGIGKLLSLLSHLNITPQIRFYTSNHCCKNFLLSTNSSKSWQKSNTQHGYRHSFLFCCLVFRRVTWIVLFGSISVLCFFYIGWPLYFY